MGNDPRSRKWFCTINNPKEKGFGHEAINACLKELELVYDCFQDETGEQGTYHTHIYLQGKNQIRFSTLKKLFPPADLEIAKGTAKQCRDYIRKEGKHVNREKGGTSYPDTFEEHGDCPVEKPGQRTDYEDLYEMIKEGKTNAQIIREDHRFLMRTAEIDRIRQTLLEEDMREKDRDLKVFYIYGKTGTGKTTYVLRKHGARNVYRVTDYVHPFDHYQQEPVIAFDEFRGAAMKIQDLLHYLDRHPLTLPCRYTNKWACYETAYLISNIPLYEQYNGVQKDYPDVYQALLRRITETVHMDGTGECPF